MLDTIGTNLQEWQDWKRSEGKLLQYRYFLGNESAVLTEGKTIILREGTRLKVNSVLEGSYVEIILDNIHYQISKLIIPERPNIIIPYKSGDKNMQYKVKRPERNNFLRSWFDTI